MSDPLAVYSPTSFYEEALSKLEEKDLLGFVAKISNAILLSGNNEDMLAKSTYLQAKGLFRLKQYKKALECISEALKANSGEQVTRLKNYEAVIYGYLGEHEKAQSLFKEVLTQITDTTFLTEVCINLSWVYLLDKDDIGKNLKEANHYLTKAKSNFALVPDSLKRKICTNYSVYYYQQSEYEKAIEVLNEAFNYAQEKDLPELYNNLAEIHLNSCEDGTVSSSVIDYLNKAELIASKYDNKIEMAFSFLIRAKLELQEEQIFSALDTLYLAFDYFTEVEAYSYSLECLLKINEIVSGYKAECMKTLQEKLHSKVEGIPYYKKILKK